MSEKEKRPRVNWGIEDPWPEPTEVEYRPPQGGVYQLSNGKIVNVKPGESVREVLLREGKVWDSTGEEK